MSPHETERLSALLDGELDPHERRVVEVHVQSCPECLARLASLRAVDDAARELPAEPPAGYFDDFATRVRARIEAEGPARRSAPRSGRAWWPAWAWAAAAALVLAVIVPRTLEHATSPGAREVPTARPRVPAAPAPEETPAAAEMSAPVPPAGRALEDRARDEEASPGRRALRLEKKESADSVARPAAPPALVTPRPPALQPEPSDAGFAAAPTPAPAPAAEAVGAVEAEAPRAPDETLAISGAPRPKAAGTPEGRAESVATTAPPPLPTALDSAARAAAPGEATYRHLLEASPTDAAGWRERREAWRAFAATQPASPHADEARVRVIEAGVEAWRKGGRAEDLERARADLSAYLDRSDAHLKERARRALESAEGR